MHTLPPDMIEHVVSKMPDASLPAARGVCAEWSEVSEQAWAERLATRFGVSAASPHAAYALLSRGELVLVLEGDAPFAAVVPVVLDTEGSAEAWLTEPLPEPCAARVRVFHQGRIVCDVHCTRPTRPWPMCVMLPPKDDVQRCVVVYASGRVVLPCTRTRLDSSRLVVTTEVPWEV